ncbi:MAG: Sec-independent protein translocase subunit TatA/TatB [Woeseiaceae bacterium]
MFGISGGELIILLLIGLVVLGPERLPRVANQIGGWLGQARRMTRVMKRQIEEELNLNESLSINSPPPPAREPSTQPEKVTSESDSSDTAEPEYTPPRDDDDYSPAHDAEDVGTGVGDEIDHENTADKKLDDDAEYDAVMEADRERTAVTEDDVPVSGPKDAAAKTVEDKRRA